MLYKRINLDESSDGEIVQFLGVYALRWSEAWGEPTVGFIEDESADDLLEKWQTEVQRLSAERDRLAAEVERLRKESELRRVNWQNAAHEGDRLRKEEEEARGRASCNAWERDRLAAENERLRVLVTAQDLSWAACRDALAVSRRWAARWKHVARLYRRLWRDAQGVAMAQADLAGELGEELARLRALLPPDAAGLLRRLAAWTRATLCEYCEDIEADDCGGPGAAAHCHIIAARADSWAARLDALAGEVAR